MVYTATYAVGDLPVIAGDAVGTAGAAAVPLIPLAVTGGVLLWGAKHVKKTADKSKKDLRSKKGSGWWFESSRHKVAAYKTKKYR